LGDGYDNILKRYQKWLERQALSVNTRRAYETRVRGFFCYLAEAQLEHGNPFEDENARDYAVRDFKSHLKTVRHAKPTSINLTLAALDHFYRSVGMGPPKVRRENLPQVAPQALPRTAQIAFLRAVERCTSHRDRAIALLLYHTGIRAGECEALNVEDIQVSARKGMVVVRSGKGDMYREIPLNAEARKAMQVWLNTRSKAAEDAALFLNRRCRRLSTRGIHNVVHGLGCQAGLQLSAHTLRHTFLTNLVRNGTDLVLVAELAGHSRLETTRKYSLPSTSDRRAAVDALQIEY